MARAYSNYYEQPSLTDVERAHQTKMIMKLFQLWNLTNKQQAIILGLPPNTGTSIDNYKKGKFLPQYRDIQDRIKHLFAIHKYLRRIYPFNKELAYRWMITPNADFNNQSPFDIICQDGYLGLVTIRNYLELSQLMSPSA